MNSSKILLLGIIFFSLMSLTSLIYARGGGGCFLPGTSILTPNGTLDIDKISINDTVLSFDELGNVHASKVSDVYEVERDYYYLIESEDGTAVKATAEHPFFIGNDTFKEASLLKSGDTVFLLNGSALFAEKIKNIQKIDEKTKAYNLAVDSDHTFFAGGFAVHNKGGGGGGCFLDGTDIQTDMSGNSKTIESLSVGDNVLSFDENGQIHRSQIVQKYNVVRDYYFIIENDLGSIVRVTAEHPFLTSNGYVEAQNLQIGSEVFSFDKNPANAPLKISKITKITRVDQPAHAYNLQVDSDHTFFANGYAVHNKGGSSGSGGSSTPYYAIEYYDCSNYSATGTGCCERVRKITVAYSTSASSVQTYLPNNFVTSYADLNCYCVPDKYRSYDLQPLDSNSSYGCKCTNTQQINPTTAPVCFNIVNTVSDVFGILSNFCVCGSAILIILAFFGKGNKGNSQWSSTISVSKSKLDQKSKQISALLSTWAKADPKWDQVQMNKTALATFTKLQECWSKRDYTEMEPLLMNSLYTQHVAQLKAMNARHEINKMDNLKILDSKIVLVKNYYNADLDEFVIWIKATAKDTIIDDRNNRLIRGDSGNGIFEEFWTFQSQTLGSAKKWAWKLRQIDQPEEGMSILSKENYDQISTSTGLQNAYTKTGSKGKINLAASREQEISSDTNVSDIKTKSNKVSRLLNFLYDNDKIWNEQKMIDNARAAFITINTTIEIGDFSSLSNMATSEMYSSLQKDFESLKSKGLHIEKRNLAVRNVEIVLVRNYYDNKKDEYTAWISGQSQTVTINKSGQIVSGDSYVADFEEYWTFTRNVDKWQLNSILKGFGGKKLVEEENFDEGSSKEMMQWYYTRERV